MPVHGRCVATAIALSLLAGCADPQLSSLDRDLSEIRANPGVLPRLEMPEVPDYRAPSYEEGDRRSPFQPQLPEPGAERGEGNGVLSPDVERQREPLEAFTLEELTLVGVLTMGGSSHVLVREPGGKVHRLGIGSYLGMDHGRIVGITSSAMQVVELVSTGGGGWVERSTRMTLGGD
ncbi:pilus assembly protein PilP [Billgrantia endophytica]|uniref:Pilus assembly protein PilQ n=1 Tax=Billgrantia endophytica TaxID=2033802 RepID=A0A2N7U6S6_9GAMM|nr:pilus assembly protein PilP [Halomonas endophytica]PMR76146.1 pilus assembly protein PilQ [Halomonas endophytica]